MKDIGDFLLWCVFPYIALGSFIFGTIVRFTWFRGGITAKSSELLEKKNLMVGSVLFHVGIIFVFLGHVVGILIPKAFTDWLGIPNEIYHIGALVMGGLAGFMALAGMLILSYRRFSDDRVFATSSFSDLVVDLSFLIVIVLGLSASLGDGIFFNPHFNYRLNLSVWARQLFYFRPDFHLMQQVPLTFKFHVICGLLIFGFFPYTRLVHALTLPWQYLFRSPEVYRRKPSIRGEQNRG
ncbi:respiratory nitrate reductase subunit gamma [Companilactobacillus sp.]|jgi:nitrate reductase gamma subunit|uniref:respiratory nitrate reductase subunit gamma n=1 Tax=Companilactobacillus sp. TaxID=2767905 RepID=UPI0025BD53DF|nr:respiratory nitrate reductase subunit gamma [Companilactobacillus sp.]MCH4009244.1 respiratory nitrate reductase subunit gamma [Companilactobacillus sp.]MCH4050577.1 respiratory nitrate reductase subunit gamma [Companilactobacillus sp.]MCH4077186.1 respiratory nitrate reductase subunit gamma [Companilactobacillus sp.]MCH4125762.1 respiratory nitrate reductase subunit gamma [Companilactobacillus sp.]MCI1311471.1 respiratory nitrate reductase subunit gamma [Companilactobacillus sp.]